jgi:hypothetical protein
LERFWVELGILFGAGKGEALGLDVKGFETFGVSLFGLGETGSLELGCLVNEGFDLLAFLDGSSDRGQKRSRHDLSKFLNDCWSRNVLSNDGEGDEKPF